jgi:DNA-binding SARP family transcriptional activator/tetratricopeptide (TPR) repeat protein
LRRWFPDSAVHWHRGGRACEPDAVDYARMLSDAVSTGVRQIVLDDLPPLDADQVGTIADAVSDLTDPVTVVLASRWPTATPAARWRGGLWSEIGPAELALSVDQVADVIGDEYGLADPELPARLHDATGGWPALVHMAAESLRVNGIPYGPLAPVLAAPQSPLVEFVTEEVLAGLPAEAVRLMRRVGDLAPVTVGLCRALGQRRPDETVALLIRSGLLTRAGPAAPVPGGPAPVDRVVPVIAEILRHGVRRTKSATATTAARWFDENGPAVAAARAYVLAGAPDDAARVLETHGEAILSAGQAETIVALVNLLPPALHSRRLRLLFGDALRETSEPDAALRTYLAVAAESPEWDAGLAWRVGRLHYQRGDGREALATFAKVEPERVGDSADAVFLIAFTAHAQVLAGEAELAIVQARRAIDVAVRAGHDRALAYAYAALALALSVAGDAEGSEAAHAQASAIAERTGDVLLLTRIFTNTTFHLLNTGRLAEALAAAQRSARYAAAAGSPDLRAIATSNEADALSLLGRFDEAVKLYERARARYLPHGSRRRARVHVGLGEVYRRRGWREQARAAYEEAVGLAEAAQNAGVLVVALAGLALVLLDDDPEAAAADAKRAANCAGGGIVVPAVLAQGWIELADGNVAEAAAKATDAARLARSHRDRAGLAEALELRAAAERDRGRQREALREAHAIWSESGAEVEAARIQLIIGRLPDAGTEDRLGALIAAERLAAAGALADRPGTRWGSLAAAPDEAADHEVVIRTFGRFEVHLGGSAVPAAQWQSRKARDLLRILVGRRGRPVPRGELCEMLWPDDDPTKTGHRLSVLLSIVRGVLDPAKAHAADHYLIADQASIALDIARLRIDVEEFLAHVAHGRRLFDRGALEQARTLLMAVERQYRADVFEDEPYAEWSSALREEARAAYVAVLRMLARATREVADPQAAAGYLLRLLDKDPYDEAAHRAVVRALVAGGQHGEARRAFDRYCAAMQTIGVRGPDGAILLPARPR